MRVAVGIALALALAAPLRAQSPGAPVLIELFTSQGCSSCPPADELLARLRLREDVVALEYHVDYWNDLVYGASGNWVDVHSRPEYTARQQTYARAARLQGRRGVYTPQMIVGGRYAAVGSDRREVTRRIGQLLESPAPLALRAELRDAELEVAVTGTVPVGATLWLARYDLHHATQITRGENRGKEMHNYHVVTSLQQLPGASPHSTPVLVPGLTLGDNQGCAVFVQQRDQGYILAAARCSPPPA